ncbi:hypothetical protein FRC03_007851 [Tulasnella sp. 419]|nr:hypothetical protein FRC03_007851 [Tulasnella sp. 419]
MGRPTPPSGLLHQLPLEVLIVIFQWVLFDSHTFWQKIKASLALSQIDRQLREVVCKTPLLWVYLTCPPASSPQVKGGPNLTQLLKLVASRSASAPLQIEARQVKFRDLSSLFEVVCKPSQVSRWQTFKIAYDDRSTGPSLNRYKDDLRQAMDPLFSLLWSSRPRMEYLTDLVLCQRDVDATSPGLFGKPWRLPIAPNLIRMLIENAEISWSETPFYPSLVELTLKNPLSGYNEPGGPNLTRFLERQTSITTLKLLGSFATVECLTDRFTMPNLVDLHLMVEGPFNTDFLCNLNAPNLDQLTVCPSLKGWGPVFWDKEKASQLKIKTVKELIWYQVTEEDFIHIKDGPLYILLAANISSDACIRRQSD